MSRFIVLFLITQTLVSSSLQQCQEPTSACQSSTQGGLLHSMESRIGQMPSKLHSIWDSATSGINSPTTQPPSNRFFPKPTTANKNTSSSNHSISQVLSIMIFLAGLTVVATS
ncbi:hypothetical protein K493DRAFT_318733 [Basidiobolus meristosporus CBS 931.73]|uniref:Uncharacterized protein n=1 Tax=Basidiobolus meristosporus CBS 931.73 TaxID=1314790 RepID=A0A1Y1XUD7_9FUNG|nr:hypothetical protein K493DRAFT_318733 [Basidiobolus meristosporus CBS 931.73]|eukprot:ORX89371.1 hypothetical protein K493DRAFT_318733 [Basidiobolus meristosporus CBS 931.73]